MVIAKNMRLICAASRHRGEGVIFSCGADDQLLRKVVDISGCAQSTEVALQELASLLRVNFLTSSQECFTNTCDAFTLAGCNLFKIFLEV
jgi:hypothetical protein